MTPDPDELITRTLTRREWARITHALTMSAAMVDALGDDARTLLDLWERVQPDGEVTL